MRQRVKPNLGNELEQKGHEIGHPTCSTKCLLARLDTWSVGLLKQAMSSSTSELCSPCSLWNGGRKKLLKRHWQASRVNCDKLHLRQCVFMENMRMSSSAHDFRSWKTTADTQALTRQARGHLLSTVRHFVVARCVDLFDCL